MNPQIFRVSRAPEHRPITAEEIRALLWRAFPQSEWEVREVRQGESMSNGPINEIGGIWPHNRYACSNRRCGWTGYREDLLHAFDPFNSGCALVACPRCKEQNIHTCCDEPGCWEPDTCGTPTPYGYRRTCWKHHPDKKKEEEKQ